MIAAGADLLGVREASEVNGPDGEEEDKRVGGAERAEYDLRVGRIHSGQRRAREYGVHDREWPDVEAPGERQPSVQLHSHHILCSHRNRHGRRSSDDDENIFATAIRALSAPYACIRVRTWCFEGVRTVHRTNTKVSSRAVFVVRSTDKVRGVLRGTVR